MGTTTCECGATIALYPLLVDASTLVPVDVDADPDGDLLIIGSHSGYVVRPVGEGEEVGARWRRRAHRRCRAAHVWASALSALDPTADRTGPCGRCGERHPHRYGPGGSPLCQRCREVARR